MERFNEVYRVYQPMKYSLSKKKETLQEALASNNYCIQLKKDGSSYVFAKDLDGSAHAYGDKISKKTGEVIDKIDNLPHVKEWIEDFFPEGSQLIAEVLYGETSKDVNSIMLASPEKAISRQRETGYAEIYIFDILFWDGEPIFKQDFAERWDKITSIACDLGDKNICPSWVNFAATKFDNKAETVAEWLASNEEGAVIKLLRSTKKTSAAHHVREIGATAARPANTTFKIKQVDTVDVVIMGVEMPTSAYTGKDAESHQYKDEDGNAVNRLWYLGYANAFTIGAYNESGELVKIGTVASGLDDEMRKTAAKFPELYIGQCIEVDCMSKDNDSKSLRHPRLMKLRPDKAAEQCIMEEIFS